MDEKLQNTLYGLLYEHYEGMSETLKNDLKLLKTIESVKAFYGRELNTTCIDDDWNKFAVCSIICMVRAYEIAQEMKGD